MGVYTYEDMKRGLVKETFLYFKLLSKVFAAPIAYAASRLGVTANQVTMLGILLSVPAAYLNLSGRLIPAIAVFHLFFLLDASDGVLARGTNSRSVLGAYLDDLAHYIFHTMFFVSFAIRSFQEGNQALAFFSALFILMNVLMRAHMDLVTVVKLKNKLPVSRHEQDDETGGGKIRIMVLGSFDFPNVIVWITALAWNMRYLEYYFIYAATMASLYFVYQVVKTTRAGFANA